MKLIIPHTDRYCGSRVACGLWWAREVQVWVRNEGDKTQEYAERLLKACKIEPKSKKPIPQWLDGKVPANIIGCMESLSNKGTWTHTILPFSQGPQEGFTLTKKKFGRMFLMTYDPGDVHGEDTLHVLKLAFPEKGEKPEEHNAVFSTHVLNRAIASRGSSVGVAKTLKDKMDESRVRRVDAGTIGKGLWIRNSHSTFKPEYHGRAKEIENGASVNRSMLTNSRDTCDDFRWLGAYRNKVIQITNEEKIFPKIILRYEDFPEVVRQADKEFFDQPW